MLERKINLTKIENASDGLSRLDLTKERSNELDSRLIEISQNEIKREKKSKQIKTEGDIQKLWHKFRGITYMYLEYYKEKKEQNRINI